MIILSFFIINILPHKVDAAQYKEPESKTNKLVNYPGYTELINNLKKQHPTWTYTIFFTGLDWNQVIKNETIEKENGFVHTARQIKKHMMREDGRALQK